MKNNSQSQKKGDTSETKQGQEWQGDAGDKIQRVLKWQTKANKSTAKIKTGAGRIENTRGQNYWNRTLKQQTMATANCQHQVASAIKIVPFFLSRKIKILRMRSRRLMCVIFGGFEVETASSTVYILDCTFHFLGSWQRTTAAWTNADHSFTFFFVGWFDDARILTRHKKVRQLDRPHQAWSKVAANWVRKTNYIYYTVITWLLLIKPFFTQWTLKYMSQSIAHWK